MSIAVRQIYSDRRHDSKEHHYTVWCGQSYMPRVGDWVDPGGIGGYYASLGIAANYLYSQIILLQRRMRFDRIGCYVTVEDAGASIRLGVYKSEDPPSYYPSDLILDAGTVDAGTTGYKEITIDLTLDKGFYYLAWISDGAPSLRGYWGGNSPIGAPDPDRPGRQGFLISHTYGALPDPFPSGGTPGETRMLALRVAELL